MLVFKCKSLFVSFIILVIPGCSAKKANNSFVNDCTGYIVSFKNDQESKEYASALYSLLTERATDDSRILWDQQAKGYKKIEVEKSAFLEEDYYIENHKEHLILRIKDSHTALWLFNQLVKVLSMENDYFLADDLPPAIIDFSTGSKKFDFDFRDPHFLSNLIDENYKMFGTHTVEYDWGIWGHNLRKILSGNKDVSLYSKRSGKVYYDQLCFSSEQLFLQVKEYILNNFGNGEKSSRHFMIMPDDNKIVCECAMCLQHGNIPGNSSPAVAAFIQKLAACFPKHIFVASVYGTTYFPPEGKWPDNTAVIISTMDMPKGVELKNDTETRNFLDILTKWKKTVSKVYIWDYAANFDDYLTPVPILYGLKKQLTFYKSCGVKGVFLNASGYDYSSFEDVKTFVSSALLMNIEYSVDSLCGLYFKHFYPVSGDLLNEYYLSLEKRFENSDTSYNIYGGFQESLSHYLDMDEFINFYNELAKLLDIVEGEEKVNLTKLYTALSFTRLQLAYFQQSGLYGFTDKTDESLIFRQELLSVYKQLCKFDQFEHLINYREVDGEISLYLEDWQKIIKRPVKNYLQDASIKILSESDENGQDVKMLVDGVHGFSRDYHMGWFINSIDNLFLQFHSSHLQKGKKLSIRFLLNDRHCMYLPDKVELYRDNVFYKTIKPFHERGKLPYSIGYAETDVDLSGSQSLEIKIYCKEADKSVIACDEILLY